MLKLGNGISKLSVSLVSRIDAKIEAPVVAHVILGRRGTPHARQKSDMIGIGPLDGIFVIIYDFVASEFFVLLVLRGSVLVRPCRREVVRIKRAVKWAFRGWILLSVVIGQKRTSIFWIVLVYHGLGVGSNGQHQPSRESDNQEQYHVSD